MIDQIKRIMSKSNIQCFQGRLDLSFPIKMSGSQINCAELFYTQTKRAIKVDYLLVSSKFDWTSDLLKSVLTHELIHVFEVQVLKKVPQHGASFNKEMIRINKIPGYKVDVLLEILPNVSKTLSFVLSKSLDRISFYNNLSPFMEKALIKTFGPGYILGVTTSPLLHKYKVSTKSFIEYGVDNQRLFDLGILKSKVA